MNHSPSIIKYLFIQTGWIWLSFASGFAALIYQVLWVKKMTSIYGSTALSVSITLVAFFSGLSVGSFTWGKWCSKLKSPFKTLALVELGIAIGNIIIYILSFYLESFVVTSSIQEGMPAWLGSIIKFCLVLLLLFPSAFLLGGTYPLMVQASLPLKNRSSSTLIYSLNTAGACSGALLGATLLPLHFGYFNTGIIALCITSSVAICSWFFSIQTKSLDIPINTTKQKPTLSENQANQYTALWFLCFISGFSSLGLEVVWTHMFAQVLQNSIYSYASILTLFLLTQAIGAGAISWWSQKKQLENRTLGGVIAIISLTVLATPFLFYWSSEGVTYLGLGKNLSFSSYMIEMFMQISIVLIWPSLAIGCLFPLLIQWGTQGYQHIGFDVGKRVSINTFGAILGSLLTGFLFIPLLGTWASIRLLACLYACLLFFPSSSSSSKQKQSMTMAGIFVFILGITIADPTKLPLVKISKHTGELLLDVKENEEGVVAVVTKNNHLNIIVNNSYTLGGTKSAKYENLQSDLPLVIHSNAKSIFYLGMGTGITAGASLKHDVEKVTVTEIVANSIKASKTYFEKWNRGLFKDPRANIIHGDGRQILKHSSDSYDVIIADLFLPWKRGSSNLYSLEHFQNVYSHLNQSGLFAQWLPLYQLTREDFDIITKTMLEVFPQISVWRGDFFSEGPIVCYIGHRETQHFDESIFSKYNKHYNPLLLRKTLHRSHPKTAGLLKHYIGTLNKNDPYWKPIQINTEDKPIIEFWAPIHQLQVKSKEKKWFRGTEFLQWMESFSISSELDSYLGNQTPSHAYIQLGLAHHRIEVMKTHGNAKEKQIARLLYQQLLNQSIIKKKAP